MNILLEGADSKAAQMHTNVDKDTTAYRTRQTTETVEKSGFALDISGTVMDNSVYAGHGRTAEEVMLKAGQEDITARRNYMAVMSNSMSDEDFARLQKEGFHPGSTDIETVVTIVDHIKAALVKGGTNVAGYTDTISDDVLKNITGSESFARELEKQFSNYDIPKTEENVEAVKEAWDVLNKVDELSEGSTKYMVENGMEPTPENLYLAQFSATESTGKQGRGYYAAGEVAGYYAKKPEAVDYEKLLPQMQKVIEDAGYAADAENIENAKWLIETGIPLTVETFTSLKNISELKLPVTLEAFLQSAACAIADGSTPIKADLLKKETYAQQASALAEQTNALSDEAADFILVRELPLTLKNLKIAQDLLNQNAQKVQDEITGTENIHGRRLLEEVRLSMTVEANLKLLRSGYQIETTSLEELVTRLKEAENSYQAVLTGEENGIAASEKASLYQETLSTLVGIKTAPAAILAQITNTFSLREVLATGSQQALAYEKAQQSYESLMTAPRSDMGDSIRKAFRNVDDILADMNLELSEENKKAVRILGYNSLEITEENIAEIKTKDTLLSNVVKEMKPGRVLNMIREGINPVTMPLTELEEYLKQQTDTAQEMESYSKFLYRLEKQDGITEEERNAYIGVYRLVRQLEKNDDAALGALWQTGAEFNLENLLTANRSSKRKQMDYSIDDTFAGVEAKDNGTKSITQQLAAVFEQDAAAGKEILEQILDEVGSKDAEAEFDSIMFEQIRTQVKSETVVQQYLLDYSLPITADHLMAAQNMLKNPKDIWNQIVGKKDAKGTAEAGQTKNIGEAAIDETTADSISEILRQAGEKVVQSLDDKENTNQAYVDLQNMVQDILENSVFSEESTSVDVRAMSNLYKQLSFFGNMAREENYEIPVSIDGSLTSINLKLVHSDTQESKVAISFKTENLGKVAAEFKMEKQELSGFCICSTNEGTEFLKTNQEAFTTRLKKEEIETGNVYFITGEKLDLEEFSLKQTKGRKSTGDAQLLYRTARAFIGFTQEIGSRKGNGDYEN